MTADPSEVVFLCAIPDCDETAKGFLHVHQVVGFWSGQQQIYGLRLPAGWSTHLFKEQTMRGRILTDLVAVFCPEHAKERLEEYDVEKTPTTETETPEKTTDSGGGNAGEGGKTEG